MGIENRVNMHALVDNAVKPAGLSRQSMHPELSYLPSVAGGLNSNREQRHLGLIKDLVEKRKLIRDVTIRRLDEIIVYCDNQILTIGDGQAIRAGEQFGAESSVKFWRTMIVDLEKLKLMEHKELFRDTLFLRNEWMKVLLDYEEQKGLDEMMAGIERKQ